MVQFPSFISSPNIALANIVHTAPWVYCPPFFPNPGTYPLCSQVLEDLLKGGDNN